MQAFDCDFLSVLYFCGLLADDVPFRHNLKTYSAFFFHCRYDLPAICDCSQECVKALLGDECTPIKEEEMQRKPCQTAVDVLQKTIAVQGTHS